MFRRVIQYKTTSAPVSDIKITANSQKHPPKQQQHYLKQPNDWSLYKQTAQPFFLQEHVFIFAWWNHCHLQFFAKAFGTPGCHGLVWISARRRAGEFSSWHRCGLIVSPTSGSTKRHAFSVKGNRGGMSWRNTSTMASSSYSGWPSGPASDKRSAKGNKKSQWPWISTRAGARECMTLKGGRNSETVIHLETNKETALFH